jgi:hypothetical protein
VHQRCRDFTISRAEEYQQAHATLLCQRPAHDAQRVTTGRESTMTNFKLLSAAMILSVAIATPVFAQQAVDEPGMQAFYQSLGVGSHGGTSASAMASTRSSSYASARVRRISSKHYAHK